LDRHDYCMLFLIISSDYTDDTKSYFRTSKSYPSTYESFIICLTHIAG